VKSSSARERRDAASSGWRGGEAAAGFGGDDMTVKRSLPRGGKG
jgi:hypothetical protein